MGYYTYNLLAPHDHQLPQRSYFLFSETGLIKSYTFDEIITFDADPHHLRAFVGNEHVGFKTAMNQRMIAIFLGMCIAGLTWEMVKQRFPYYIAWYLGLLLFPMLADGFSHRVSETSGERFRETNAWAVQLSGGIFSSEFYMGTTIGSLNWWLRVITGFIFGVSLIWLLFLYLNMKFTELRSELEPKLRKAGVIS